MPALPFKKPVPPKPVPKVPKAPFEKPAVAPEPFKAAEPPPEPPKQATSIFDNEDPWLKQILTDQWNNQAGGFQRDLLTWPYEALKAFLFFLGQGGVNFRDQFVPGPVAARWIRDDIEQGKFQDRQTAAQNLANRQYNDRLKAEAKRQPLPYRQTPKYI